MPSFRATLQITGLRPGHAPEEVMDMAVAAVGAAHVVEANQLDIVAGTPRIRSTDAALLVGAKIAKVRRSLRFFGS